MASILALDAANALAAISIECFSFSEDIMMKTAPLPRMASRMQIIEHSEFDPPSLQARDVRAIQGQRGKEQCFSTDKRYGCTEQCEWRKDCLKLRAVWLR